jgi:hypothetical protein
MATLAGKYTRENGEYPGNISLFEGGWGLLSGG